MQKFKIGAYVKTISHDMFNHNSGKILRYDSEQNKYQVKLKNPVKTPTGRHISHWYHETELRWYYA